MDTVQLAIQVHSTAIVSISLWINLSLAISLFASRVQRVSTFTSCAGSLQVATLTCSRMAKRAHRSTRSSRLYEDTGTTSVICRVVEHCQSHKLTTSGLC